MNEVTVSRFMKKVNKTETCWLWTGSTDGYGHYGKMNIDGKTLSSHRLSYLHHHGEIPEGLVVRHKCRTMKCVNPNHLELGTYLQNNGEDRLRDGTMPHGEKHTFSKLTNEQVLDIRSRTGQTLQEIADEFKISNSTTYAIRSNKAWKHL